MRKIQTPEELERSRKRNVRILSGIMLFLLIASTLGFAFSYKPASTNPAPNNNGNGFTAKFQGKDLRFSAAPSVVQDIPVEIDGDINSYAGKVLYLDAESEAVQYEIGSTLGLYTQRLQSACYGKCDRNLPEKDCSEDIIIWKKGDENKVYQKDKCVFIEGDIRSVDAFLYKIFGII